jgi:hypothetical protein
MENFWLSAGLRMLKSLTEGWVGATKGYLLYMKIFKCVPRWQVSNTAHAPLVDHHFILLIINDVQKCMYYSNFGDDLQVFYSYGSRLFRGGVGVLPPSAHQGLAFDPQGTLGQPPDLSPITGLGQSAPLLYELVKFDYPRTLTHIWL